MSSSSGNLPARGHFVKPAVVTNLRLDSSVVNNEIFGPIAPILEFTTESEVFTAANNSTHGLASYVFTKSLNRAHRAIAEIQAGMVAINQGTISNVGAPFGGIKQSGLGREGGPEGLAEYVDIKYAAIALDD